MKSAIAFILAIFSFLAFLWYSWEAVVMRWAFMAVGWKGWGCLILTLAFAWVGIACMPNALRSPRKPPREK